MGGGKLGVICLMALALMVADGAAARRGPDPIELSGADDGRIYRVPVGAEFEVRLEQTVGEPWRWEMRDDPGFIMVDPPWREGFGSRRGDRENRVFTVRVTRAGRLPLVFEKLSTFGARRSLAGRVGYLIVADGEPGGWRHGDGAPPGPVRTLGEADAGRVTRVPADGEIVLRLPFARRLDQRWQVIGSRNVGFVAPVVEEADPGRGRNIFWLDSTSVVRLRPGGPGDAEVTLAYLPPSPGSTIVRQLRFRFVVE